MADLYSTLSIIFSAIGVAASLTLTVLMFRRLRQTEREHRELLGQQ